METCCVWNNVLVSFRAICGSSNARTGSSKLNYPTRILEKFLKNSTVICKISNMHLFGVFQFLQSEFFSWHRNSITVSNQKSDEFWKNSIDICRILTVDIKKNQNKYHQLLRSLFCRQQLNFFFIKINFWNSLRILQEFSKNYPRIIQEVFHYGLFHLHSR